MHSYINSVTAGQEAQDDFGSYFVYNWLHSYFLLTYVVFYGYVGYADYKKMSYCLCFNAKCTLMSHLIPAWPVAILSILLCIDGICFLTIHKQGSFL